MFRLCAFADEAGPSLEEQMDALCSNQMEGLEVRGISGRNFISFTKAEALETARRLQEKGLRIWSVGSPIGKIGIRDEFAPHRDQFKATLELAAETGASCIRLFSFYIPAGEAPEIFRDEVMERLERFIEDAKEYPVKLCHENEKGIYGDMAVRCLDIHKTFPELHCVFDPANYIQCGQDTLEAWEMLKDYVYYMHIKDALSDGRVVPPGKGDGHLAELLDGYKLRTEAGKASGVLTLEPHLSDFVGLSDLEQTSGIKSIVGGYHYADNRAAFDAAAAALRELIG